MANGEVEINGFKTSMIFSTGTGSNFIPENEVRYILPNYMDCLKPSKAKLYWNIQGEIIGEVYLDIKYENKKVNRVPFCVVRGASAKMPVFNEFGCVILIVGGIPLVIDEFKMFPGLSKFATRTKDGFVTKLLTEGMNQDEKGKKQDKTEKKQNETKKKLDESRKQQDESRKQKDESKKKPDEAEMSGLKAADIRAAATERGWEEITGKKKKSHLLKFKWMENGNSDKWDVNINPQTGWVHLFKGGSQMTENVTNMAEMIGILDKPRNLKNDPPKTHNQSTKEVLVDVELVPDHLNIPMTLGWDAMKQMLNES